MRMKRRKLKNRPEDEKGFVALEDIDEELVRCVKCGSCRSVCPVFLEEKREPSVARGKIALTEALKKGVVDTTGELAGILDNCILCLTCAANCPNGVDFQRIMVASRAAIVGKRGLPPIKRIVLQKVIASGKILKWVASTGSMAQYLLFRRIPEDSGLKRRFPIPYVPKDKLVPQIPRRNLFDRLPELSPAKNERMRAFFFTGCAIRYLMPEVGEALVRVLNDLGVTIIMPEEQVCCGAVAEAAGDLETFWKLTEKNRQVVGEYDFDVMISACGTGGRVLKELYKNDPQVKVMDISELLVDLLAGINLSPGREIAGVTVTYHDSCHLRKGQGVIQPPRQILRAIFGENFVEMEDPARCCGSGGSYGVTHPDISARILSRKMEDLKATGAGIIVTGCPGCMIQLRDGVHRFGLRTRVMHLIEVVAGAEPFAAGASAFAAG